jgi:peroxiredoxin
VFRAELLNKYEDLDCNVFGTSPDSRFVLAARGGKDLRLPFSLLSNYKRGVCRDYQCLYDEFGGFKGVRRRAAYVIDREDTIRYSYNCPDPAIFLILRRSSNAYERSNDAPDKKLSSRAR